MRIERDAVGARDRRQQGTVVVAEDGGSSVRRVDMEPHVVTRADVRDVVDRIDRAGIDLAGGRDDGNRPQTGGDIFGDRAIERGDVHAIVARDRDEANCLTAEAHELDRLARARMPFR